MGDVVQRPTAPRRDAPVMEEQAINPLSALANRIENDPEVKAQVLDHFDETPRQEAGIRTCTRKDLRREETPGQTAKH